MVADVELVLEDEFEELTVAEAAMIVVSLMTPAPGGGKTRGLTHGSIHHLAADEIHNSWDRGNKLMAGIILLLAGGMWLYFSPWLN